MNIQKITVNKKHIYITCKLILGRVRPVTEFIKEERTIKILENGHFDYVVDCIDTLSPKVELIKACVDRQIPVVSSLGAGGKTDPSQIQIADISKSYQCKLARYVRKRLHESGIRTGVTVVFSPELVDQDKVIVTEKAYPKNQLLVLFHTCPLFWLYGCKRSDT
ncbi:MAG: ThiF family adenylyltransferase [Chitinophagaceae bacterium]|nr:ThiF family adenylyltransferase [Chitinophagaceae bacterium]